MNILEKHNKEVEEKFDEEFTRPVVELEYTKTETGLKKSHIKGRGMSAKGILRTNELKSFITSQNKSLLKKIAKGEILRLGDRHFDIQMSLTDYQDNPQHNEAIILKGELKNTEKELTHWQQVLQDLER